MGENSRKKIKKVKKFSHSDQNGQAKECLNFIFLVPHRFNLLLLNLFLKTSFSQNEKKMDELICN